MTLSVYILLASLPLAWATSLEGCKVSVVGAGWAGIYSAWRLAVDQPHLGRSICLFEAYNRPGGRTYTTRIDDYLVDAGAYRFALDMHLPADLITNALGLLTACYDPTCKDDDVKAEVKWPYNLPLSKIVGFDGRHLGYGAALDSMLANFEAAGGRLFLGAQLTAIVKNRSSESWQLSFKKVGQQTKLNITAGAVLLNLPRSAHKEISGLQEAASSRWAALQCSARQFPSTVTEASTTTKVYAIYEDAWWVSKLGLLRGVRENVTTVPPVSIHYHDGEVLCAEDGHDAGGAARWMPARSSSQLKKCRGVLQVFYRHNATCPSSFPQCMDYWTTLPRSNMSDPLTVVSQGTGSTPAGDALRVKVHKKLIEMHKKQLLARGLSEKEIDSLALPSSLVYSVWYHQGTFPAGDQRMLSGPQDIIFPAAQGIPASCGVDSVTNYQDAVEGTGPWTHVAPGIHFVNNDFSATETTAWHGPWAEQSLLGAERMLAKAFGLEKPSWLNETYYNTKVLRKAQPDMHLKFV